ncbi:VOC family protein [Amycolatopsis sp. NPDC005232]|uniref:VOC family protein n=1 Tax=Amycolatopsis sp. NPDC005232 TaxID=3157027 RepID=UPI0033A080B7
MNVNHIGVTVGDLDEAIEFYSAVFELRILVGAETATRETAGADRRREVFGERWREMRIAHLADDNDTGVELFQFIDPEMTAPQEHFDYWRIGFSHLAFTTPDLDSTLATLEAHGGSVRTGIHEVEPGRRISYCKDPWGNPIELSSAPYPAVHPPATAGERAAAQDVADHEH